MPLRAVDRPLEIHDPSQATPSPAGRSHARPRKSPARGSRREASRNNERDLSLIHISEPTRLALI
eukprot:11644774-Alexandrium_andersonii.AAC.1